jgi:hypothetical protein
LSGCSRLESIPYCCPEQTPETWCIVQPCVHLQLASWDVILVQPSSTVLIYFLGFLTIGMGFFYLRVRSGQRSRLWWGVALLLWGSGALLAGTSYQAFSYEIKCAGRDTCTWTSWWEIVYLALTVASVNAIVVAQAFSCTVGRGRKLLLVYALGNAVLYLVTLSTGAFVPIKFLISFELMILFTMPTILIFFLLNAWRYHKLKRAMDLALLGTWIGLSLTTAAYYLCVTFGMTEKLWSWGIWFSDNDVLHIGLILWMSYIGLILVNQIGDAPDQATASGRSSPA